MTRALPKIDANGFRYPGGPVYAPPCEEQIDLARAWLRENCEPRKTINRDRSSYSFKHDAERATGGYIANGAFLVAAQLEGYKLERVHRRSPNAYINISFAPARKRERDRRAEEREQTRAACVLARAYVRSRRSQQSEAAR